VEHPIPLDRLDALQLDRAFSFGNFLVKNKRFADASAQFEQCLKLKDLAIIRLHLGVALEHQARLDEAATQFQKALDLEPDFAEAHRNLGVTFSRLNRPQQAIEHLQQAVRAKPDYSVAHHELGLLLNDQGRFEAAVRQFQEALRIEPDQSLVHLELAKVLHVLERFEESVRHNIKALRLDPENLQVLNNLAWQLATCPQDAVRNGEMAVKLAEHAGRLTKYKSTEILDTLAAAMAETGRFQEAIRWQQELVQLLPSAQRGEARQRLELYQQSKPYRQRRQ
jgi:tetratricopeptide (TPR) repeat protein